MVGHAAAGAEPQRIFAPNVLPLGERPGRVKAAAGKHYLPVKACLRILQCINLDHASHFAAILRRKAGGIDAHRLHVVRFNLRSEAGRTIIRKRNAIHHKLSLILRTARMQHGIAFV